MSEKKELTAAETSEARKASEAITILEVALTKEQTKEFKTLANNSVKRMHTFCKSSIKLSKTNEAQLASCKTQASFIDCMLRMKRTNALDIAQGLVKYHFYSDIKQALKRVKRHFKYDVQSRAISRNAIL